VLQYKKKTKWTWEKEEMKSGGGREKTVVNGGVMWDYTSVLSISP
jgi:hypothetical protein